MKRAAIHAVIIVIPLLVFSIISYSQSFQKLHKKGVLIDFHNDILSTAIGLGKSFDQDLSGKTYSDLNRMLEGGIDIQIFSVFCGGEQKDPYAFANREIDTLYAWINRNPDKMMLVTNPKQLNQAVKSHKLGAMIGVEGGHMIEEDLSKLEALYDRGVRYMTLTWNNSTNWATSAMEETNDSLLHQPKGLSAFGKQVIKKMNSLGMMIDLSHVGEKTFWDAIKITTKPVIVSHSSTYALAPVFRNLKDDQILAVGKNNGVIGINFYSGFLDSSYDRKTKEMMQRHQPEIDSLKSSGKSSWFIEEYLFSKYKDEAKSLRPSISLIIDHIDHIVKLIGINHVGLGSDFDGITSAPKELNSVLDYPLVTKALMERGYHKQDIKKILGENFIRVFTANQE